MNHITAHNIIFQICFCDSATDIAIFNQYSWVQLAHRFCNAIDSNISSEPPTGGQELKNTLGSWFYEIKK